MPHPYRTSTPPEDPPARPEEDGCPDGDIAVVLLVLLAASVAHVVWVCASGREVDLDYGLAVGTGILCLAALRPVAGWLLRRGWREIRGPRARGCSAPERGGTPS